MVGAVSWLEDYSYAVFEYAPEFLKKRINLSPITMNIDEALRGDRKFEFPSLNKATFLGLPGLLADAMPDKFGNQIINTWLLRKGRDLESFNPVERLCYMGKRSMGALEFFPAINNKLHVSVSLEIDDLVALTQEIMSEKSKLNVTFSEDDKENSDAIIDILRVGTSAGGARPKAIVAINKTGKTIIGQAVPSVAPGQAARYFQKTECFCFTEQALEAKQEKVMPVIFVVDPEISEDVKEITLSYTFFIKPGSEVVSENTYEPPKTHYNN